MCVWQYIFTQRSVNFIKTPYWPEATFSIFIGPSGGCAERQCRRSWSNQESSQWQETVGAAVWKKTSIGQSTDGGSDSNHDDGQTTSMTAHFPTLGWSFIVATGLPPPFSWQLWLLQVFLFYKVVSYSSRSWIRASSLYCSLGGDGEHSKAKMAFRRLRSKTCLSHAGYLFLNRSILMTDSSIRGGRDDGVDGAVGLTWKTGTHPSRSANFWSRSLTTLRLLEMDRSVLVATSGGRVKAATGSSQAQLGDCPNLGPLGWKKA